MARLSAKEFALFEKGQAGQAQAIKVRGGHRARASGKDFEAELELTHEAYASAGWGWIQKLPVGTNPMPHAWLAGAHKAKSGICRILSERAAFDYMGCLGPASGHLAGRMAGMEAKATGTREASIAIIAPGAKGSGLKAHQLQACAECYQLGAITAMVWRNGPTELLYFPGSYLAAVWQEYRLATVKRIPASRGHRFDPVRLAGIEILDWLRPLLGQNK
jgi:hypothetical protein